MPGIAGERRAGQQGEAAAGAVHAEAVGADHADSRAAISRTRSSRALLRRSGFPNPADRISARRRPSACRLRARPERDARAAR